jgi:hypothetical protein
MSDERHPSEGAAHEASMTGQVKSVTLTGDKDDGTRPAPML